MLNFSLEKEGYVKVFALKCFDADWNEQFVRLFSTLEKTQEVGLEYFRAVCSSCNWESGNEAKTFVLYAPVVNLRIEEIEVED